VISVISEMTAQALDEERCWQAVLARDSRADGRFVMGVRSTGIYCRPTCPARRPARERVRFFVTPAEAEAAGFRACLRCQPQRELEPQMAMAQRACRYIEANPDADLSLAALGAEIGVSSYHLQRTFKRIIGVTPHQYAVAQRRGQLKASLKEGETVTNALYDAGYSPASLYTNADAQLGMTPATYRRGGEGMSIAYTIAASPLGRLLVAATERGVSAVSLGDDDASLEASLRHEYPAANIRRDDAALDPAVAAILRHLEGQQPHLNLPLDVQATAFQQRVWQALRAIPYGSTRSYAAVAKVIGHPTATRAVAHACATNHVAIVIPCHRVVRENGDLGGYRWGIERKRTLLANERASET
jgi:AraC family transcriptional regulator, regulatory protein of adaptative response / methylated-DNA-[protein]-cysteine methyltransferase